MMSLNECFILLTMSNRKGNFLLNEKTKTMFFGGPDRRYNFYVSYSSYKVSYFQRSPVKRHLRVQHT